MNKLTILLQLIRLKVSGGLRTNARYMRDFVKTHPDYKKDSIVTEKIQYDLLQEIRNINEKPATAEKKLLELLKFDKKK